MWFKNGYLCGQWRPYIDSLLIHQEKLEQIKRNDTTNNFVGVKLNTTGE